MPTVQREAEMPATALTTDQPNRQAIEVKTRSRPGRVTGKLAIACKSIVWEGHELDVAAKAAGLTTRTLRLALERPHVINWVKAEREVFRAHVSSQNIHRAKELRDSTGNAMASLGAMKFIEQIGDDNVSAPVRMPGFSIVVNVGQPSRTEPNVINTIDADKP